MSHGPTFDRLLSRLGFLYAIACASIPAASAAQSDGGHTQQSIHLVVIYGFAALIVVQLILKYIYDVPRATLLIRHERAQLEVARNIWSQTQTDPEAFFEGLDAALDPVSAVRTIVEHAQAGALAGVEPVAAEWSRMAREMLERPMAKVVLMANASVYLGLFGTIAGLAFAVYELQSMPVIRTEEDLKAFAQVVQAMLGSFGQAFVSAASGVGATLALNYSLSSYERSVSEFLDELSDFVIHGLIPNAKVYGELYGPQDEPGLVTQLVRELDQTLLGTLGEFRTINEQSAQSATSFAGAAHLMKSTVSGLSSSAGSVATSSQAVADAAKKIDAGHQKIAAALLGGNEQMAAVARTMDGLPAYLSESKVATDALTAAAAALSVAQKELASIPKTVLDATNSHAAALSSSVTNVAKLSEEQSQRVASLISQNQTLFTRLNDLIESLKRQPSDISDGRQDALLRALTDIRDQLRTGPHGGAPDSDMVRILSGIRDALDRRPDSGGAQLHQHMQQIAGYMQRIELLLQRSGTAAMPAQATPRPAVQNLPASPAARFARQPAVSGSQGGKARPFWRRLLPWGRKRP